MSYQQPERRITLAKAKENWQEVINELGLNVKYHEFNLHSFTTQFCYLKGNLYTARGIGKGKSAEENQISACFEALEFYLTGYHYRPYPITMASLAEIEKQYPLYLHRGNPSIFSDKAPNDLALPWVIFQDIESDQNVAVPMISVDLGYSLLPLADNTINYLDHDLYAASNGVASGNSYEEAVLNGALEIIERDAYSYFLIDTYLLEKPMQIVNNETLPQDLIELVNLIESRYQNKVIIVQMPSRFDVHVYMAILLNQEHEIQPRGAGASLNAHHAMERALYELIQGYNSFHGYYNCNQISERMLQGNHLIRKFLEAKFSQLMAKQQFQLVSFQDNRDQFANSSPTLYLNKLISLIKAQAARLLINVPYQHANGLTCIRAIIPEAEEFFIATHYIKRNPLPKTQAYIQSHLGTEFNWANFNQL